jgi:hypothetical protein
MPRKEQNRVLDLVEAVTGDILQREACPDWLQRPGIAECGQDWDTVRAIYAALTGLFLPEIMPPREWRSLDALWTDSSGRQRIIEYDEEQHFNRYRKTTLQNYPESISVAFDKTTWQDRCLTHEVIRGGNFSKPKPPLFPMNGGRNYQRAFRDMLTDVLPPARGWEPTIRIAHFEVVTWLKAWDAETQMKRLLESKVG